MRHALAVATLALLPVSVGGGFGLVPATSVSVRFRVVTLGTLC